MKIFLELNGLNCVNCAGKIENMTNEITGVNFTELNFVTKKLTLDIENQNDYKYIKKQVDDIVNKLEPDVDVIEIRNQFENKKIELELNGLNCSDCAKKIEDLSGEIDGVESVEFNFITKKLKLDLNTSCNKETITKEIIEIINKLEPDVEIIDISDRKLKNKKLDLKLEGLNCSDCAANIEKFSKSIKGVEFAEINLARGILNIEYRHGTNLVELISSIEDIVHTLEPDVVIKQLDDLKIQEKSRNDMELFKNVDKKELASILISIILLLSPRVLGLNGNVKVIFYLISYLMVGNKVIKQAFINIKAGIPFDENFLMSVATIVAFAIGEYPEAIMVMLLYKIGETMQGIAVNHSRESISALMNIRPDYANLLVDGKEIVVDPLEVSIGDVIIVKPGERVPLDGIVTEGKSSLDTSSITGESVPKSINVGDNIISGVVNIQGLLKIKVEKEFGESTISKILDLVENASSKKAETENFITKFSKYYTPVVVIIAMALGLIPPLLNMGTFGEWFYRAAVFLVISCPCALVISVPLGFFGGLGGASKKGILIKGSNYLEALSDIETVVFDKTGTLTEGVFKVTEIKAYDGLSEDELLKIAAYGERYSNHPIGKSIITRYGKEIDEKLISNYEEIAGKGISVEIESVKYLLGNKSLMDSGEIEIESLDSIGTVVYISRVNKHIGTIIVSDKIKEGVKEDLISLKSAGVNQTVMLSGDNEKTVEKVGSILGIDRAYGNLLPQDKVEIFEKILSNKPKGKKVVFVGDGVNDAPVLARADVGIAMGGLGSDAAIEASDVVIMTDDIGKIAEGIKISRKTRKIVTENIVLALGVKLIVLALGALGIASMWQAVFADVGVSIIAILNSIRALNTKKL